LTTYPLTSSLIRERGSVGKKGRSPSLKSLPPLLYKEIATKGESKRGGASKYTYRVSKRGKALIPVYDSLLVRGV